MEMFSFRQIWGHLYIPLFKGAERASNLNENSNNGLSFQLVNVVSPVGMCVLTLQKSVKLFELLHSLVF